MLVVTYRNTTIRGDTFSKRFHALVSESGVESFTFHDLKAKGVSDFDGDKKAASGHRSEAMVSIYDSKRKFVDATDSINNLENYFVHILCILCSEKTRDL